MINYTRYTEIGKVTVKDDYEEIGWSVFDSSTIYKVKRTKFSISDGVISESSLYASKDGSEYRAAAYRNANNGFTAI